MIRREINEVAAMQTAVWKEASNWFVAQLLAMPKDKKEDWTNTKAEAEEMLTLFCLL